jgi:hypothetical protein
LGRANAIVKSRGWQFVPANYENSSYDNTNITGRQSYILAPLEETGSTGVTGVTGVTGITGTTEVTGTTGTTGVPANKYDVLNPNKRIEDEPYPMWSDWLPLTIKKAVDTITALRNQSLQWNKAFPLEEAKYKQAGLRDAFTENQIIEN